MARVLLARADGLTIAGHEEVGQWAGTSKGRRGTLNDLRTGRCQVGSPPAHLFFTHLNQRERIASNESQRVRHQPRIPCQQEFRASSVNVDQSPVEFSGFRARF